MKFISPKIVLVPRTPRICGPNTVSFRNYVEVHRAVVLAEDVVTGSEGVHACEAREAEHLLVLHVLEDLELAEIGGGADLALAFLRGTADLQQDGVEVFAAFQSEEIFLAEFETLRRHLELFDPFPDASVEILRIEFLNTFQRIDHPANRFGRLPLLIGREKESVDEVGEGVIEALELELDPARDLRKTAVEGVEPARMLDLLSRAFPFTLRVIETSEHLEGPIAVWGLDLRDLEELDCLRRLVLGNVVLREPDVLGGVDLITRPLHLDLLSHRRESRRLGVGFLVAYARQIDPQSNRPRFQFLGHLVEMDRLVVHPLVCVAPGQRQQVVRFDGNRRLTARWTEA
jgi:hypothetical protein